jgi:hypothetical protein
MSFGSAEDNKAGRIAIGVAVAAVLAGAGGWWWWSQRSTGEQSAPETLAPPPVATVAPDEPPPIEHPLEADPAPPAEAAGPPQDPDVAAQSALLEVFGGGIAEWLISDQLARRLVATTDNLARNTRIEPLRPLRAPATPFVVEREAVDPTAGVERIVLSPANYARYDSLVALVARTDAATAAAVYRRIFPQLQDAYEEIGYPGRYFNDRLVAVIDHLLETPEPAGPLLLVQPKVMYRYADAQLEALSPGQKLLLRIGTDHARTVKQKLREFRTLIARPAAGL